MRFKEVENKEKYFIQPLIKGNEILINISTLNKEVVVKGFNKKNKSIKILKRIENELVSLYKESNYFGFEIYLKGFITITKKRKSLLLFDILLKNEYEGYSQSKKYVIRLENLNIRFLKVGSKNIKSVFTFKYNEKNLEHIINQFIKSNLIDGLVFHKDIPYNYCDDEIIEEIICEEFEGVVNDGIVGTFLKKEVDEETNKIIKTEEIPCMHFIKVQSNDEIISIPLDNFLDKEKAEMFTNFQSLIGKKCIFKKYSILDKNGYFIVNIEK
jgi:hypothetical protein